MYTACYHSLDLLVRTMSTFRVEHSHDQGTVVRPGGQPESWAGSILVTDTINRFDPVTCIQKAVVVVSELERGDDLSRKRVPNLSQPPPCHAAYRAKRSAGGLSSF